MPRRIVLSLVLLFVMVAVLADARGKADKKPAPAATTTTATTPTTTTTPTVTSPPIAPLVAYRYYQDSAEVQYTYIKDYELSAMGCCFMSCLGVAQTHARRNLTAQQIDEIRSEAVVAGDLEKTYFVNNYCAVINRAFSKLGVKLSARVVADLFRYENIPCNSTIMFGLGSSSTPEEERYHYQEGTPLAETWWNPHPTVYITKVIRIVYISISGYLEYTK